MVCSPAASNYADLRPRLDAFADEFAEQIDDTSGEIPGR
jgi:hypothetical protein